MSRKLSPLPLSRSAASMPNFIAPDHQSSLLELNTSTPGRLVLVACQRAGCYIRTITDVQPWLAKPPIVLTSVKEPVANDMEESCKAIPAAIFLPSSIGPAVVSDRYLVDATAKPSHFD